MSDIQETAALVGDLVASPPPCAVFVSGFRDLGFRVRMVTADTVDLMVDGVNELRRLQLVANHITALRSLVATLEIVTDDLGAQYDDEWWIEFSVKRADRGVMRDQDFKDVTDVIDTLAGLINSGRRMAWPSGRLPTV